MPTQLVLPITSGESMTQIWMERSRLSSKEFFLSLSSILSFQVDFREFMLALCVMRTGSAEENLKQIFRAFDVNSDGKVERSELGSVAFNVPYNLMYRKQYLTDWEADSGKHPEDLDESGSEQEETSEVLEDNLIPDDMDLVNSSSDSDEHDD